MSVKCKDLVESKWEIGSSKLGSSKSMKVLFGGQMEEQL
jgi:hypothetical protein